MQKEVVMRCRQMGKPVIVASHLLQSMIEYPTPTRAEVFSFSCRCKMWPYHDDTSVTKPCSLFTSQPEGCQRSLSCTPVTSAV